MIDAAAPKPRRSNKLVWIVVIVGLVGVTCMLCCGGMLGLSIFGMGELEKDYVSQLESNPLFVQEIGSLRDLKYDIMASGSYSDWGVTAYTATGSRGSGLIVLESHSSGTIERIDWAVLFPDSGGRVELMGYVPAHIERY